MNEIGMFCSIELTALDHHHRHFRLVRTLDRERARIARPDLGQFFDEVLPILGPDVSAVHDNDVFLPTNDHDAAFYDVANISGVKPPVR